MVVFGSLFSVNRPVEDYNSTRRSMINNGLSLLVTDTLIILTQLLHIPDVDNSVANLF